MKRIAEHLPLPLLHFHRIILLRQLLPFNPPTLIAVRFVPVYADSIFSNVVLKLIQMDRIRFIAVAPSVGLPVARRNAGGFHGLYHRIGSIYACKEARRCIRCASNIIDHGLHLSIRRLKIDGKINGASFRLSDLRRNLNGQTRLPTQPGWASQSEVLAGYARFNPPDMLIREDRLARDLPWLAQAAGLAEAPPLPPATPPRAFLAEPEVLQAARTAYQRDYTAFGFRDGF